MADEKIQRLKSNWQLRSLTHKQVAQANNLKGKSSQEEGPFLEWHYLQIHCKLWVRWRWSFRAWWLFTSPELGMKDVSSLSVAAPNPKEHTLRNVASASVLSSSGRSPWLDGTHLPSSHGDLLLSDATPSLQYYTVMYTTLGAGEGAHSKTFQNLNRTIRSPCGGSGRTWK